MPTLPRSTVWLLWSVGACAIAMPSSLVGAPSPTAPPSNGPATATAAQADHWRTWGGPRRDFTVPTTNLANSWPEGGPLRLWSRGLGDGYSAIAEENGIRYTAYRRENDDVVTALEAGSGKTIWETPYAAPFKNAYSEEVGPGPYAMPQVVGDRVVMASGHGQVLSLDKRSGRIAWSHN